MSANDSPLSGYWARKSARDMRVSAETMELVEQLAGELERVEAGEFHIYSVLERYSPRDLLAAQCYWGLTSEETLRFKAMSRAASWAERERA